MRREPKRDPLDDKIWNKRVRAHAERSTLSFAEIARRAEIPERRLRRMLNGDVHIRMGDAWAISHALGARVEALFHDPGQRRAA